jgi:hypothetical protein
MKPISILPMTRELSVPYRDAFIVVAHLLIARNLDWIQSAPIPFASGEFRWITTDEQGMSSGWDSEGWADPLSDGYAKRRLEQSEWQWICDWIELNFLESEMVTIHLKRPIP